MVGTSRCDVPARKAGGIPRANRAPVLREGITAAHFLAIGSARRKRSGNRVFIGNFADFWETAGDPIIGQIAANYFPFASTTRPESLRGSRFIASGALSPVASAKVDATVFCGKRIRAGHRKDNYCSSNSRPPSALTVTFMDPETPYVGTPLYKSVTV